MTFKKVLSPQEIERYERINSLIEAAIPDDDKEFLNTVTAKLAEAEGDEPEGDDDPGDVEVLPQDVDGDQAQYALTLDDGSELAVGEPDEIDEEGNAIWHTDEGPIVLAAGGDEDEDYDDEPEFVEEPEGDDEEEISFDELAAKFPVLAAEIARRENTARAHEANMDPHAVVGRLQEQRAINAMESVLLESRILAEQKLAEANIDPALLTPDELVGLDPTMMDRKISKALRAASYYESRLREAMTVHGGGFNRGGDTGGMGSGLGKRLLAGACRRK